MKSILMVTAVALGCQWLPSQSWAQVCEGKPSVCTKLKTVEACAQCVRDKGWAGQSGGYVYCRCWLAQRKK